MTIEEIQELSTMIANFTQSLRDDGKAKDWDLPPPRPRPNAESAEDNDSEVDVIICSCHLRW